MNMICIKYVCNMYLRCRVAPKFDDFNPSNVSAAPPGTHQARRGWMSVRLTAAH